MWQIQFCCRKVSKLPLSQVCIKHLPDSVHQPLSWALGCLALTSRGRPGPASKAISPSVTVQHTQLPGNLDSGVLLVARLLTYLVKFV